MILKNEVSTSKVQAPKVISTLSYEYTVRDSTSLASHLCSSRFCIISSTTFVLSRPSITGPVKIALQRNARTGPKSEFSTREKLYICLLRLKRGCTLETLAALLSTPERSIDKSYVREIFTTFIQLMYVTFRDMQEFIFPERAHLSKFLPKVFKTMKKIRCVVDCTEFRVECSRNFARQGNTFSSYKHTNTFKCLIAVTPNGGACFVSDLLEGDIDDVQIFKESGLMKHLQPHDVVLADRGFTV